MIRETLSYLFHSICCPSYLKKLGLLQELIAIESRYARCKDDWQAHIEKCRDLILDKCSELKRKKKVIVLGAGILNDIPIRELSLLFDEVILVDIFFMQGTINKIKEFENVGFVETEITGTLEYAYYAIQEYKRSSGSRVALTRLAEVFGKLEKLIPNFYVNDNDLDLVISLNLLSQLPLCIKSYIEKTLKPERDMKLKAIFDSYYKALISNHIHFLKHLRATGKQVLLISDTEKLVFDKSGKQVAHESSVEDVDIEAMLGLANHQWQWDLAPVGELDKDYAMKLATSEYNFD